MWRKKSLETHLWQWRRCILQGKKYKLIKTRMEGIYKSQLRRGLIVLLMKQYHKSIELKLHKQQEQTRLHNEEKKGILVKCFTSFKANL